ncbi:hypothetical protein [Nonomuraea typhae]|uniref:hypothetical protein n=1 Tax=Nonomuraea typhae TaxID=2603600 RepID=UPI0012F9C8CD|nr:hypothetical protein [Nonomuraea typhae]
MTSHEPFDGAHDLEAELMALGDAIDVPTPPPSDVAAAVRARLERADGLAAHPPAPGRRDDVTRRPGAARRRRRWVITAVVLAVVVAITAATPQGRAAVAHILRLAGIELRITETPPPALSTQNPLPGEHTVEPGELPSEVAFRVGTPAVLGPPKEVRVGDEGRIVSMFWDGVRLDQFQGGYSPVFFKEMGEPWPENVPLRYGEAWWITGTHRLSHLKRGDDTLLPLRMVEQTLIWQRDGVGYRLEGVKDRARAAEIANSLR